MQNCLCQIEMLGGLRIRRGEQIITRFPTYKTGALLARLAYFPGRVHSRQELIALLWPEVDTTSGRGSLRQALTFLRRYLEPSDVPIGSVLIADRHEIRLAPGALLSDVADFEALLRRAAQEIDSVTKTSLLVQAVSLYGGELLPGHSELWVLPERMRLMEAAIGALYQLLCSFEQTGDRERALDYARQMVRVDPLREQSCAELMRLYLAADQPTAALRQYHALKKQLHTHLGEQPSEALSALAEQCRCAERTCRKPSFEPPIAAPAADAPASEVLSFKHATEKETLPVSVRPKTARFVGMAAGLLLVGFGGWLGSRLLLAGPMPSHGVRQQARRAGQITLSNLSASGTGTQTILPAASSNGRDVLHGAASNVDAPHTSNRAFLTEHKKRAPEVRAMPPAAPVQPKTRPLGPLLVHATPERAPAKRPAVVEKPKLSSDMLWVSRIPTRPSDKDSEPTGMVVDKAGNIYVTGFIDTEKTDVDYVTLKYAPDGKLLWQRRYNGPGNDLDRAASIALDAQGNVYVTGESDGGSGNGPDHLNGLDIATIKYAPDGRQVWVRRFDGKGHGKDGGLKVATDTAGHVYVLGYTWGGDPKTGGTDTDYTLLQYDTTGNLHWARTYNSPRNGADRPNDMVVDRTGAIYITGASGSTGITLKYDAAGQLLWERHYVGDAGYSSILMCMAADPAGSLYIVGYAEPISKDAPPSRSFLVLKYSPNGNLRWTYRSPSDTLLSSPKAIAINRNSDIYVTGSASDGKDSFFATIQFKPDGRSSGLCPYRGAEHGANGADSIAIDSRNNAYITGAGAFDIGTTAGGRVEHSGEYATVKYDCNMNLMRVLRYSGDSDQAIAVWQNWGRIVVVDSADNVTVTGRSLNGRTRDIVTVKYRP